MKALETTVTLIYFIYLFLLSLTFFAFDKLLLSHDAYFHYKSQFYVSFLMFVPPVKVLNSRR